jgi:DNA-binding HxlR family transcriptional regulator
MPNPPRDLTKDAMADVRSRIASTVEHGASIRRVLAEQTGSTDAAVTWEVQAAVEALDVFGSRWTIEILSALYIAGPTRFNNMKSLLDGISSRTLSDKLTLLTERELVIRKVDAGPPERVTYVLSEHGKTCGKLLSPLVAHLKIRSGALRDPR